MRLTQLRNEIEQSARNPLAERAYPITSDWIPITDVLAIVDRFEKDWRREFESVMAVVKTSSYLELQQLLQKTIRELLS
jgi:hypothetical protein